MVAVLKLILLMDQNGIKCQTDPKNEGVSNNPLEASQQAFFKYGLGDIDGAQKIFSDHWKNFASIEMFQTKYLSFLLKTGQYQKMLELKNIHGVENLKILQQAKDCLLKLHSNNPHQVASLLNLSPDSFEANSASIRIFLESGEAVKANQLFIRLEKMYPNQTETLQLGVMVNLALGNIEKALSTLSQIDKHLYNTIKSHYSSIQSSLQIPNVDIKLKRLLKTYQELYSLQSGPNDRMGLYGYLYKLALRSIVEIGCDHSRSVESFARQLLKIEKNEFSIFYYIKSLIIDRKLRLALEEISRYDAELGTKAKASLNLIIQQIQRRQEEEERAREEERKRKLEWEEQQKQRAYERQATNKAGTDFLGHYKTLGVDKNSTVEGLKKAHRKKVREASKKMAKSTNLTQEQKDKELTVINKAYQILSNPEKKKMYDLGIDPEKGPQPGEYRQGHNSGGFFDEDQVNDIFQSFFGGRGRRGGRGYQRTQYIFL